MLRTTRGTPGHVAGAPQQRTLLVHLIVGPVPADLGADRVHVLGGVRVDPLLNPVRTEWAYPADAVAGGAGRAARRGGRRPRRSWRGASSRSARARALVVRTSSSGDWSTYVLALLGAGGEGVPAGFDEPLASEPFRFTVDCPSDLDCRIDESCPPVPARPPPAVDYLARDYAALRTPAARPRRRPRPGLDATRNPADPIVTLVELLAYRGGPAHLLAGRHRRRVLPHDGAPAPVGPPARAAARLPDARGLRCPDVAGLHGRQRRRPARPHAGRHAPIPGSRRPRCVADAIDAGATVFETRGAVALRPARNLLELHAWGDVDVLPAGRLHAPRTSAIRPAPTRSSRPGDVVVLVAGRRRRGAGARRVRLRPRAASCVPTRSPAATPCSSCTGRADDALEVPLPVATRAADGTAAPAAQSRSANIVLAEHAATLARSLSPPQVPLAGPSGRGCRSPAWPGSTRPSTDGSAAAALLADPRRRAAAGRRSSTRCRTWDAAARPAGQRARWMPTSSRSPRRAAWSGCGSATARPGGGRPRARSRWPTRASAAGRRATSAPASSRRRWPLRPDRRPVGCARS